MRGVASRVGLTLSNVQYHYPTRQALLTGVVEHHLAACSDAMRRGRDLSVEDLLADTLRVSLCDADVLAASRVFRDLFALAELDAEVAQRLRAYYRAMFDQVVEGLTALDLGASNARVTEVATVLMTSVEGFYLVGDATPVDGARLADVLHTVAMSMLQHTATAR